MIAECCALTTFFAAS